MAMTQEKFKDKPVEPWTLCPNCKEYFIPNGDMYNLDHISLPYDTKLPKQWGAALVLLCNDCFDTQSSDKIFEHYHNLTKKLKDEEFDFGIMRYNIDYIKNQRCK